MRKIVFLVALVSLMVFVSIPASAAILSFEDYITDYGVDANNQDFVECTMPATGFLIHVMNGASIVHETTGSGYTYNFASGQDPGFRVYPFGAKNRMELKDIPNGTLLDFSVTVSNSANAVNGQLSCFIQYFDGDLALLSTTTLQNYTGGIPYTWDISHVMNYPDGAEYFQIYLYLNGWTVLSSAASFGISCSDFVFTMDIRYLPDDSAVLASVNKELADMNDKLDDMISGGAAGDHVTDQAGSVSDSVGQVDDFTSDIEAELNEGLANILDFSGLDSLAPAFVFIGKYVDKIWYSMGDLHVVYFFAFGLGVFLMLTQHVPRVPSLKQQESQQEAHRNYVASLRRGHNPIDYTAHGNGQSHSYTVVQDSFFD